MATFMLDCDAVTSASNSISALKSQTENLANSIGGYDTSNDDGFDFDGAKAVMQKNVEATVKRIDNTVQYINSAVEAHTQLQASLGNGEIPTGGTSQSGDNSGSPRSGGTNNSGTRSGGNYSRGGGYSGGGSSGGGGGYSGGGGAVVGGTVGNSTPSQSTQPKPQEEKIPEIKHESYKDLLTVEELKKLEETNQVKLDEDGYLKIDDCYVIACNKELGKVGDKIKITQKDGKEIECIVGKNIEESSTNKTENSITFMIDKEKCENQKFNTNMKDIKVENMGEYKKTATGTEETGSVTSNEVRSTIDTGASTAPTTTPPSTSTSPTATTSPETATPSTSTTTAPTQTPPTQPTVQG